MRYVTICIQYKRRAHCFTNGVSTIKSTARAYREEKKFRIILCKISGLIIIERKYIYTLRRRDNDY